MPISQDTITQIHTATDIVAVVREYTELKRRGGNDWWGCCPFHNEKTASFHVDGDKGFYYCFGCHAGGDVLKFVMDVERLSYGEAVGMLAKRAGIEVKYTGGGTDDGERQAEKEKEAYIDLYERTATMFHYLLTQTELGKRAYAYIKGRGITDQTIAKFRLGYAPADRRWLKGFLRGKNYSNEFLSSSGLFSKKYPDVSFFSDRLMFPIMNRSGKCVAFGGRLLEGRSSSAPAVTAVAGVYRDDHRQGPKYLNSGDMVQYKKGDVLYAFNFAKKAARDERRIIFCEGYMDCIAYHQCGITFAVAPLGTALTENQLKSCKAFVDTVLLSFDSDGAGKQATKKAILMCRKMGIACRVIVLRGGKDPAEIMLKLGKDVLTKYVDDAILDADFLLHTLGEECGINTSDGKVRCCQAFFEYVDALGSSVLVESCMDKLSRFLSLNAEAVRQDYERHHAQGTHLQRKGKNEVNAASPSRTSIRKSSQLRAVLAAVVNVDLAHKMTDNLEADDFSDETAKGIFRVLKRCAGGALSEVLFGVSQDEASGVLPKGTQGVIMDALSSGEYTGENAKCLVEDSVAAIKREARKRTVATLKASIVKSELLGDGEGMSRFLEDKARLDSHIGAM